MIMAAPFAGFELNRGKESPGVRNQTKESKSSTANVLSDALAAYESKMDKLTGTE